MTDIGGKTNNASSGTASGFDRKLLAYALAGGAALAAPAHADIISYSGPTLSTLSGPINLDLNNDLTIDFIFTASDGPIGTNLVDPNGVNNGVTEIPMVADASVATAELRYDTARILNSFKAGPISLYPTNVPFPNASDSYIGLTFEITGLQHYGWALVNPSVAWVNGAIANAETLVKAFAYETTPGADIRAGQTVADAAPIPEPSTMALLALGSAGLAIVRRRSRRS